MQTFLPYPGFRTSASVLDDRRLGKQRVEAYQILRALTGVTKGWQNHPAVKMWRGSEEALEAYMNACITEWVRRGFRNTMKYDPEHVEASASAAPPWLGDQKFHAAHRSNLLRKDPEHYGVYGWVEGPDLPYEWPEGRVYAADGNRR